MSISDAASYFNINYRTISRNLDTKKATYQGGSLVYLLKKEMGYKLKEELSKTPGSGIFRNQPIWVYDAKTHQLVSNGPFEHKKLFYWIPESK